MGQQALEAEWKKVLKATQKYSRKNIDKYTQVYIVNLSDIKTEVTKALNTLLPPGTTIPDSVNKHCSDYCRQLYIRYKAIAKAGRTVKMQYRIEGTSTNFVVIASSLGKTSAQRAQVNRELNSIRTNKSSGVISNSLKSLKIKKDLNADKSPLGLLRANILKSVFQINVDTVDLSQDSKVLDVILGARYTDKEGNYITKRETGLLHFGHLEGFAVVEQRAAKIISTIKKTTEVEIGSGSLEKYLTGKSRVGEILGGFNVYIDLDKVAAGSDEFNVHNMSKQEERQLLRGLRQQFFDNAKEWAEQRGSSSISQKGEETLIYTVGNVVDTAFSSVKSKRGVKYKPSKVKKPSKERPTKTKPIPITRTVTEETDTVASNIPESRRGKVPKPTKASNNWLSLINIINQKLPKKVAQNMGAPGLVYRTGRFANSTKVVNVETTREGYPSIVFDYQRNPYDVFDRTLGRSPWNTPARDPRALVDKSVREIVRELAIGKFYTRRA